MAKRYKVDYYSFLGFILFACLIVFVWRFYYGYYILYPFTILGTWFHEMGHGIMSIMVGGEFLKLEIFPNGSGLAWSQYRNYYINPKYAHALVSSAGLLGPPVMGSILILMSKSFKKSKIILYVLSISMIISVVIWIRTTVGIVVILSMGFTILFVAIKAKQMFQQFLVQLIGIMACISTYRQLDYLFMDKAIIDGVERLSDSSQIAQNLGMSYSFWGMVIAILSFVMLTYSLYLRNRTRL